MLAAGISGNDQHACRRVSGSVASAEPWAGRCSPAAGAVRSATVPRRPGKGGAQRLPPPPAGSAGCPRACRRLTVKGSGAGTPQSAPLPPQQPSQPEGAPAAMIQMSAGQLTDTPASAQLARRRLMACSARRYRRTSWRLPNRRNRPSACIRVPESSDLLAAPTRPRPNPRPPPHTAPGSCDVHDALTSGRGGRTGTPALARDHQDLFASVEDRGCSRPYAATAKPEPGSDHEMLMICSDLAVPARAVPPRPQS